VIESLLNLQPADAHLLSRPDGDRALGGEVLSPQRAVHVQSDGIAVVRTRHVQPLLPNIRQWIDGRVDGPAHVDPEPQALGALRRYRHRLERPLIIVGIQEVEFVVGCLLRNDVLPEVVERGILEANPGVDRDVR